MGMSGTGYDALLLSVEAKLVLMRRDVGNVWTICGQYNSSIKGTSFLE
jgi:hypothetical protein